MNTLSKNNEKVRKTTSAPNLYVIRNGKLCERTPKNQDQPKPTTKLVNHTINHLAKVEERPKDEVRSASNSVFHSSRRVILN